MSEADGIKGLRAKALALADAGGPPTILRPKRKRAFHRALRRGEQWAIYEQSMKNLFNETFKSLWRNILSPSFFIGLSAGLGDKVDPIKIKYGKED